MMGADQLRTGEDALAFVQPPTAALDVDGVQFTVTPATVRQLRELLALVQPVLTDLALLDVAALDRLFADDDASEAEKFASNAPALDELIDFILSNAQRVTEALALCTAQPIDWLDGLLLDRYLHILVAVVRVNSGFFGLARHSLNAEIGQLMGGRAPSTVPMPSSAATPELSPG